MTAEQSLTAEHWVTYAEAAERLGLTPEAVRALARRQHWPRRSPNAVGGQTWIVVPAESRAAGDAARLTLSANGHADSGQRTPPAAPPGALQGNNSGQRAKCQWPTDTA